MANRKWYLAHWDGREWTREELDQLAADYAEEPSCRCDRLYLDQMLRPCMSFGPFGNHFAVMDDEEDVRVVWGESYDEPVLFLCGPYTGHEDDDEERFSSAYFQLRGCGYQVIDPMELCYWMERRDWDSCMCVTIPAMLRCSGVALMDGWEDSRGAVIESDLARRLGMPVATVSEWMERSPTPPEPKSERSESSTMETRGSPEVIHMAMLRPCPRCGSTHVHGEIVGDGPEYVIRCGDCHTDGPRADTEIGAATLWNKWSFDTGKERP